jgi:circadian clock protein KaiC
MEFIVRGIRDFNEPGVFMAFEEREQDLAQNTASLGFDLPAMIAAKKLALDYVHVERSEIEETGEYNLEGLFVRLNMAIEQTGAKRVAIDTLEALFAALPNEAILRAELRRLFRWLKERNVTAVITAEQGRNTLTRHGLEEYVSDCVIFLDHRIDNQVATRRLRVVKYRGSSHGTNEYPTMIDQHGLSVLPISSLGLDHQVSRERVPTGVPRLDAMLGGKGLYRGSTTLISGTAGTGKSSLAAAFVHAACARGERSLYFALEEAPAQIVRNMASIGIDLNRWLKKGLLRFHAVRPTLYGIEQHLVTTHTLVEEFTPSIVVMDPITNLKSVAKLNDVQSMLTRMIDFLKSRGITGLFTSLTEGGKASEQTETDVSSLMDTWLLVRNVESGGERNRLIYVLKSRGMAHSNQVREFILSDCGIELRDVYLGRGQVLTGSARLVQEEQDAAEQVLRERDSARRSREIEQERHEIETKIEALRVRYAALQDDLDILASGDRDRDTAQQRSRSVLARARRAD